MISADSLNVSFGATAVLRGISIDVDGGEVLALMGPSGSGKTTLLHCLAGLITPDAGTVIFDGEDITRLDSEALARLRRTGFGFVFQRSDLLPELTLRENVALPLELTGWGARKAGRAAEQMLAELGLAEAVARRPGQVSGGQQQRAAVARALIHSPRVVFADEPTGNLDSENGLAVLGALTRISRAQGSAVVLVTHDSEIASGADRIVHLRDGSVAA